MAVSNLYSALVLKGNEHGERNDCGVIALALACDLPYHEAHALLYGHGRKARQGTPWHAMWAAVHDCGFNAFNITRTRAQWGSVSKVLGKLRPNRTYLVHTSRHVLCVKGGEVHDWTAERRCRIRTVWQILPK